MRSSTPKSIMLVIVLLLLSAPLAFSQAVRWDLPGVYTTNQSNPLPGGMYQVLALPGATVQICSGTPCVLATTYTDATAGTPCPTTAQLTRGVSPACYGVSDSNGGAGAWLIPGNYAYTVTTAYDSFGPYAFGVDAGGLYVLLAGGVMSGPLTTPVLNNVQYPATFSALQASIATCVSLTCTIVINSSITTAADLTIPSYVVTQFNNGAVINYGSHALTINGPIQAPAVQIFSGSGAVVLGAVTSRAAFEWFGAVGDASGAAGSGTVNNTAMQACLTALTNGQCVLQNVKYRITSPLSITKSNVGIAGVSGALTSSTLYPTPSPSTIVIDSSTADALDVTGTNLSAQIQGNKFNDFTVARTQSPGTNAAGMRVQYSSAMQINFVMGLDHTACFYFKGVGSVGVGYIENSGCEWGYQGFAETSGSLGGFIIDSSGGISSNSLRIRNSFAASNLGYSGTSAWITYGLQASGTSTHDLHVDHFESANTDYGAWIDGNSAGFFSASDIFLNDMVNDGNWRSSILVRNVDGTVTINGGWQTSNFGGAATPVVDIENSHHVVMSSNKVLMNGNATAGITANNSNGVNLGHNDIIVNGGGGFPAITFGTTTQSVISGNTMNGGNWGTNAVVLANTSVSNTVSNNTIQGTATNGINIDAGSVGISGLETNSVGNPLYGLITNLINDPSQNGTTVVEALRVGDDKIPGSGLLTLNAYKAASGQFYCLHINDQGRVTNTGVDCGAGGGAVTSVGLTTPSWLTVAGSPVTTTGTLAVTATTAQTPHQVIGTCGAATSFGPCALVAGDIPTIAESQVTNLTTDLAAKVGTGTTVNGHALSTNVVVSASDLTTGTLPHAQLPTLLSGDIPNNAANTSGTSGGLTGTPAIVVLSAKATEFITNAEFSLGTCTTAKTIDPVNGNRQKVTLTNGSTCALTFTQPASGTATVQLKITQSAVSAFDGAISGCKWPGGVVPTITQTTGAVDMLSAYLDGTNAYCQIAQAFN